MSTWKADVAVSMPKPSEHEVLVGMYGFGYTQFGITHDLNTSEYEVLRRPSNAPTVPPNEVVRDDAFLDEDNETEFL